MGKLVIGLARDVFAGGVGNCAPFLGGPHVTQYERYLELRPQVEEKYEQLRQHLREEELAPFWETGIAKARKLLLPYPDFEFMGHPGLRGRMGTHPRKNIVVKAWLEENFDRRTSKKALIVDEFGGTPTDSFIGYDVSDDVIKFLYYGTVFSQVSGVKIREVKSVFDWGGGYGAQAKIFKRMGAPNLTYTIADIPPVCVLQWLYLAVLFGEDAVNLITQRGERIKKGKINIIPSALTFGMASEHLGDIDLFVSTNALNECPVSVVKSVVKYKDWFGAKHVLLRIGKGRVLDEHSEDGYYDLRAAAEAFGKENLQPKTKIELGVIVRSR